MLNVPELFRKSVYDPGFYRSILDRPFSFSLRYFYSLAFALALALTLLYAFTVFPAAYSFFRDLGPRLETYPEDLVIEVHNGEASMNRTEPFTIAFPEPLRAAARANGVPATYLLVVDPSSDYRLDRFRSYDALMWVAKHDLAFADKENDIQVQSLAGTDLTLDRGTVLEAARAVEGMMRWAPLWFVLGLVVVCAIFVVLLSGALGYLLLSAFLIWAVLKFRNVNAGYKKAYQVGIHAASLGVILDAVGYVAGVGAPVWLGTVLMLVVVWVNFDPVPLIPVAESV